MVSATARCSIGSVKSRERRSRIAMRSSLCESMWISLERLERMMARFDSRACSTKERVSPESSCQSLVNGFSAARSTNTPDAWTRKS